MALALYDLDETLINGDCSNLWIRYLSDRYIEDPAPWQAQEHALMQDYYRGELDIHRYVEMQLQHHIGVPLASLDADLERYLECHIRALLRPGAIQSIRDHQAAGDRCVVISASTRFLVEPIARLLGISDVIAIEIELDDDRITGRTQGIPTYREGKVTRLQQWLDTQGESLQGSWFYSDSHNDLPLLEKVDNPVAVSADARLNAIAAERGWQQRNW
ncbi:HAD family hydrolase [Marinobacterium rhizophilum]|uniref:HAD family hydrolase n=1 Tax=Marinobacterium rhizophilum TaxID=420402 RepID=A0ABY5HMM4_9GAMM|nr:HAD family hydrolase [Marinobacterium rhizophilum]UTW13666.1 HAD family hydrolase [Marinobacterium rhizophilum]